MKGSPLWPGGKGLAVCCPVLIYRGLFVHRKFIVGSTPSNPINLKEGVKAQWPKWGRVLVASGIRYHFL